MGRVLVTGSRTWTDSTAVENALSGVRGEGVVLVHGGAKGADAMADTIWRSWGLPVEVHLADWDRFGRAAGPIRNNEMVKAGADVCFAFIRAGSRGASQCADAAERVGIPTTRFMES